MFETIAVPVWVVWVVGLLALAGLLDRILMPSVSWYLRRRLNRVIGRLNERLSLQIPPFKLTKRRIMVDRLAHDPKIIAAILEHMQEEDVPYEVAQARAVRYAREIVPSFSAFAYFALGTRAARWLSEKLYRVRLGYLDEGALDTIDPAATVVFVMNHRSNMDYVLVTYLAARRSALAYAVGEWARVWPLKQIISSMGAYFIRRKSRNQLYRRVLARYVQMATEGGVAQAVFPEGGLTRQGELLPAKLGLLSYIVAGFDPEGPRDVVFVPVGLNYDRVLEDRVLLATANKERASFWQKLWGAVSFIGTHIVMRLRGKYRRFGYASVSFGHPLSLRTFLQTHAGDPDEMTRDLGDKIMLEVGKSVPILPVSLLACVVLGHRATSITREDLHARALTELQNLLARGAYTHIRPENHARAIEQGIEHLLLRKMLLPDTGGLAVNPQEVALLRYYANAIAHLHHGPE